MGPQLQCQDLSPWFMLYNTQSQIVGVGFKTFGNATERAGIRHYNELLPIQALNVSEPLHLSISQLQEVKLNKQCPYYTIEITRCVIIDSNWIINLKTKELSCHFARNISLS